jgi:hypothetical protein
VRIKRVSGFVLVTLVVAGGLDFAGLAFGLFYEGVFFDNAAHFLTSLGLVALFTELACQRGRVSFGSGRQALLVGAILGLVGGCAWELVEVAVEVLVPAVYNPPLDTVIDVAFGTLGGAVGAWRTQAYLAPSTPRRRKPR